MIHVDPEVALTAAATGRNCDFYVLRRKARRPGTTYEFSYAVDATNLIYGAWAALIFGRDIRTAVASINSTLYEVWADMVEADTAARLPKNGDKALRPLHLGRQRHQDRIHVAAGLETKNRATIM